MWSIARLADGSRALYRAHDDDRDQSYFLFATTREQLDVLRFPLGGMPKARVRELAREFGLAIADKQDSQDICFVPTGHYADVIERLRPGAAAPGEIVDLSRPRARAARGHHPFHRRAAEGPEDSARASRFMCCGSTPARAASWSGRAPRSRRA